MGTALVKRALVGIHLGLALLGKNSLDLLSRLGVDYLRRMGPVVPSALTLPPHVTAALRHILTAPKSTVFQCMSRKGAFTLIPRTTAPFRRRGMRRLNFSLLKMGLPPKPASGPKLSSL